MLRYEGIMLEKKNIVDIYYNHCGAGNDDENNDSSYKQTKFGRRWLLIYVIAPREVIKRSMVLKKNQYNNTIVLSKSCFYNSIFTTLLFCNKKKEIIYNIIQG